MLLSAFSRRSTSLLTSSMSPFLAASAICFLISPRLGTSITRTFSLRSSRGLSPSALRSSRGLSALRSFGFSSSVRASPRTSTSTRVSRGLGCSDFLAFSSSAWTILKPDSVTAADSTVAAANRFQRREDVCVPRLSFFNNMVTLRKRSDRPAQTPCAGKAPRRVGDVVPCDKFTKNSA